MNITLLIIIVVSFAWGCACGYYAGQQARKE